MIGWKLAKLKGNTISMKDFDFSVDLYKKVPHCTLLSTASQNQTNTNNKWKVEQPLQLSSSISWSHSLFLTQLPYIINHSFSAMGLQSWILIFYSPFQKIVLLSAYYCIKDPHPNLSIEVGLAESLMRGKEKRLGSDEQYREKDSYILKDVFNCHLYHWWEQVRNVFRTTLAASNQEVWPVPVSFRQSKQQ